MLIPLKSKQIFCSACLLSLERILVHRSTEKVEKMVRPMGVWQGVAMDSLNNFLSTMPYPSTLCRQASTDTALQPFQGWPVYRAGGLRASHSPFNTPCRTRMERPEKPKRRRLENEGGKTGKHVMRKVNEFMSKKEKSRFGRCKIKTERQ
jgi:hypothetical protein